MTKTEILNLLSNCPYVKAKSKFNVKTTETVVVYNSKVAYAFWNVRNYEDDCTHCVCQIYPNYKDLDLDLDFDEDLGKEMKFKFGSELKDGGLLREIENEIKQENITKN